MTFLEGNLGKLLGEALRNGPQPPRGFINRISQNCFFIQGVIEEGIVVAADDCTGVANDLHMIQIDQPGSQRLACARVPGREGVGDIKLALDGILTQVQRRGELRAEGAEREFYRRRNVHRRDNQTGVLI